MMCSLADARFETKIKVGHMGDPSVGIQGVGYDITVTLSIGPDFSEVDRLDADDRKAFESDLEAASIKFVEYMKEWIEPEFKLRIESEREFNELQKLEAAWEKDYSNFNKEEVK